MLRIDRQKLVIGLLSLLSAFGAKYIYDDLDDYLEEILDHHLMRKIYIFAFVYLATEDWFVSLVILAIYSFLLWCCLREKKNST